MESEAWSITSGVDKLIVKTSNQINHDERFGTTYLSTFLEFLLLAQILSSFSLVYSADADIWYHAGAGLSLIHGYLPDFSAFDLTVLPQYFFDGYLGYHLLLGLLIKLFGFRWGTELLTVGLGLIAGIVLILFCRYFSHSKTSHTITLLLALNSLFLGRITQEKGQAAGILFLILWLWAFQKKNYSLQFISQFIYTYAHNSFILPPILLVSQLLLFLGELLLVKYHRQHWTRRIKEISWTSIFITLSGLIFALLFHPQKHIFFKSFQTVIFSIALNPSRSVGVGGEWYPPSTLLFLFTQTVGGLVVFFLVANYWGRRLTFLQIWWLLIAVFAWIAPGMQTRQAEVAIPVMIAAISYLLNIDWELHLHKWQQLTAVKRERLQTVGITLGVVYLLFNYWLFSEFLLSQSTPLHGLPKTVAYLQDNVPANTRIFHPSMEEGNMLWYQFGNRYKLMVGLDNTFLIATDPDRGITWKEISDGKRSTKEIWETFHAPVVVIGSWSVGGALSERLFNEHYYKLVAMTQTEQVWVYSLEQAF